MPESLIINNCRLVSTANRGSCLWDGAGRCWRWPHACQKPGDTPGIQFMEQSGFAGVFLKCFISLRCRILPAPNALVREAQAFHFSCTCLIPLPGIFISSQKASNICKREKKRCLGAYRCFGRESHIYNSRACKFPESSCAGPFSFRESIV